MSNKFHEVLDAPEKFDLLDRKIFLTSLRIFFKSKQFWLSAVYVTLIFSIFLVSTFLSFDFKFILVYIFCIVIAIGFGIFSPDYKYDAVVKMIEEKEEEMSWSSLQLDSEYNYLRERRQYYFEKIITSFV